MKRQILLSVVGGLAICGTAMQAAGGPLKVYLLVGQSNMQGHAQVRTFDHIGMDPKTAPILKAIRNADGTPKVCENVWISSVDTAAPESERHGRLTAGYGASGRGLKIGPELTFGIYMKQHVDEPILVLSLIHI